MDVQPKPRERVFSILNNNDCPSFQHRQTHSSSASSPSPPPNSITLPPISSFAPASFSHSKHQSARPHLFRRPQFGRDSSISSAGSPPLLRFDSTSSASSSKSNSSMEGTPSPITPAYNYNEPTLGPYDSVLRQDLAGNYLPSPTGITPFMDTAMMIAPMPVSQDTYHTKSASIIPQPQPIAPAGFPIMPMGDPNSMPAQMPTPSLSANASVSSTTSANQQAQTSPNNNANNNTGKKNKYPCPYAASHNCSATFTTSGHAARHGKKHTGEKGVHCPVCDKAFTRKDNMKQHERTHKNHGKNGDEKKTKAQITREALRAKESQKQQEQNQQNSQQSVISAQAQQQIPPYPAQIRKSSSGHSEPSDVTLAPNPVQTPVDLSPGFFVESNPQIIMTNDSGLVDPSMYPPLSDEVLLAEMQPSNEKINMLSLPPPPTTLVRGFSDLDTLAQAAEATFIDPIDPYYTPAQF